LRLVKWDAPDLLAALQATIDDVARTWTRASLAAPGRGDADTILAVARVLSAIHLSLYVENHDLIRQLEERARAFLRQYDMDLTRRTAPKQIEDIAGRITDLVTRNKGRQDPRGMAELFLCELDREGEPWARKLAKAKVSISKLRPGTRARMDILPDALKKVRDAFQRELLTGFPRGIVPGERLVQKGLEALGVPGARSVFSYKAKRTAREGTEA